VLHDRRVTPASRALGTWLTASTVNIAGSVAATAVLPIVVYRATEDPTAVSVLAVLEAAPYLLLGLLAGHLADRLDRRRLIIGGLLVAAVVAGVQAAGLIAGLRLGLLYGCALAGAVVFVLTDAAELGLLPRIVPADRLARAWGRSWALADGCAVLVPPAATTLLALTGAGPLMLLDASSFLLAAALITRLRPPTTPAPADGLRDPEDDWRAGLRFIARHPNLRHLVPAGFFNSMGFGAVLALLVVYAVQALHLDPGGPMIGLLLAATAFGRIGAGLVLHRLYAATRIRLLVCGGMVGCAVFVFGLVVTTSAPVAVLLLVGYGGMLGITLTTAIVYRQESSPERIVSRVMTVGRMIGWGGQPLGAATAGVLARYTGVRTTYAGAAVLFLVAAAVAARAPGEPVSEPSGAPALP
jgi:MFS family permease